MIEDIVNYRRITDNISTSGQPSANQLKEIRDAGYLVLINLAMPDSMNALADEGSTASALGLEYFHIPVDFKNPVQDDLEKFFRLMDENRSRKVFVHCALNMRVSCFIYLYRVLKLGVPEELARKDMLSVWQPDDIWQAFIDEMLLKDEINRS